MKKFLIQCLISWGSVHKNIWGVNYPPPIVLSVLLVTLLTAIPALLFSAWLDLSGGLGMLTWVALIVTTPKMYEDASELIASEIKKFEGTDD